MPLYLNTYLNVYLSDRVLFLLFITFIKCIIHMVETQTYLISKCNSIAVCINFTHPTYIRIVLNIIKNKLNFDSALWCKKKKTMH